MSLCEAAKFEAKKGKFLMWEQSDVGIKTSVEVKTMSALRTGLQIWLELRQKERIYDLWKKRQAIQEDYKDLGSLCRKKIRRTKYELEFNLAAAIKDNKTCFYQYISHKRRSKEDLHPLLDGGVNTVTKDEKKGEVLSAFFASVTNIKDYPTDRRLPSLLNCKTVMGSRIKVPITEGEMVSDLLH